MGASKNTIKYDYSQLILLNNVLANAYNKYLLINGIFSNPKDVQRIIDIDSDKTVNDFYAKASKYEKLITGTYDNFSEYLDSIGFEQYSYFDIGRGYSEKDFLDIILSYYSTFGDKIFNMVKKYFEEERIHLPYYSREHNLDNNVGVFFVPITSLSSGYVLSTHKKYNTYSLCSLAHELGHALDAEMFLFPQKKTIKPLSDILVEVPSTTFEFGLYYYLIKNKIDPSGALVLLNDRFKGIQNYSEHLDYLYNEDDLYLQKDGSILVPKPDLIDKDEAVFDEEGNLIFNNRKHTSDEYSFDKNENVILHRYLKYPFRDDIIYGLGYYTALHFCEIMDSSIEEFNKTFNNFITSRKEASLQECINKLGISVEEYMNCDFIKDRVKNDVLMMKKRFNE